MAAAARNDDLSNGHGCFPPTACIDPVATKTYFNNKLAQIKGSKFQTHTCGEDVHLSATRITTSGSTKVVIENQEAIRVGDPIACGDSVGQGSPNVEIG